MSDILNKIIEEKSVSIFNSPGNFFLEETLAVLENPVKKYMQTKVIEISPETDIQQACTLMAEKGIHRLIVTKNNKIRGILTTFDLVKYIGKNGLKK